MDREDEEFETFLRQFRLREPGPLPEVVAIRDRRHPGLWVLAAAVLALVVLLPAFMRYFPRAAGPHATVEAAGDDSSYEPGERIEAGRIIRSGGGEGLMLALDDDSRLELRSQTELLLESAADGVRIRLNDGGLIVSATAQPAGHLYVQTRDATASVIGTVFLVNSEPSGTLVATLQGEVHVEVTAKPGATPRILMAGEQFATAPAIVPRPILEEIAWSRNAAALLALLPPPSAPVLELKPQIAVQPIQTRPIVVQQIQPPAATPIEPIRPGAVVPSPSPQGNDSGGRPPFVGPAAPRRPKKEPREPQPIAGADGRGKEIVDRACSTCHAIDFLSTLRLRNRGEYAAFVSREISRGADISEDEFPVVVDYLFNRLPKK